MVRVLITEAHEGLGLALVKEYLADAENQVIAFCGDESKRDELDALNQTVSETQLLVVDVNLADEESIKASVEPIEGFVDALDLLILNHGFIPSEFNNENFLKSDRRDFFTRDATQSAVYENYFFRLFFAPKTLRDSIYKLLISRNQTKLVAIAPHFSYSLDSLSPSQRDKAQFYPDAFDKSHILSSIAYDIDPNIFTVYEVNCFLVSEDLSGYSYKERLEINNLIEVYCLKDQREIDEKARLLYQTIPKLRYGYHIVDTSDYIIY